MKTVLDEHINHISFHTPAHNGGVYAPYTKYDVTELSYTDNLLGPKGAILELQKRWAERYKVDHVALFTNGATGAIFAAICAVHGKIAVVGSAHVSVFHALDLMKRQGVFLQSEAELSAYIAEGNASSVKCSAAASAEKKLGAIVVTYPTYLGEACNLEEFRRLADKANATLIIDSAHGSHFAFCSKLPISATEYGDLVIYSLHKTLPVLTGGALIACTSEYKAAVDAGRQMTHTTSPSYLTLLSMDEALGLLSHAEENYTVVLEILAYFQKEVEAQTVFRIKKNDDPTRLVLTSPFAAEAVAEVLEQRKIFCEYVADNYLVFIVTPYNKQYLSYLAVVLKSIVTLPLYTMEVAVPCAARRELALAEDSFEAVQVEQSEGRILNREVGLYPPGVPLYFKGEKIDKEAVRFMKKNAARLFGLAEKGVFVVK